MMGLVGCNMPAASQATATADPAIMAATISAAQTEAVQTVYAQLTQSAALTPSVTPTVPSTATPLPTIAPLPAIATQQPQAPAAPAASNPPSGGNVPVQPAPTAAPTITSTPSAYQCSITSLSPSAGATYDEGEDFDLNVTIKNTGTETWSGDNMDFDYISGAEFQEDADAVDMPNDVKPGDSVDLTVDMAASEDPGDYTAVWGLVYSGTAFCNVTLSITIED